MESGPAAGRTAPFTDSWLAPLRRNARHPDRDQALVELFVPAAQGHTPEEKLADPRLRRVIEYLHGSFAEEISLDGLALVAGLSPNYFLHAFKQTTGQTPHRYLTELRIAKACELLHNPYWSIVEISLTVGFSSQSHLTTVFRRFVKTTPAAYREEVLGIRAHEAHAEAP